MKIRRRLDKIRHFSMKNNTIKLIFIYNEQHHPKQNWQQKIDNLYIKYF